MADKILRPKSISVLFISITLELDHFLDRLACNLHVFFHKNMKQVFNINFGLPPSSEWFIIFCETMAQIPLGSTRLDTFDFVEPVEQVETSETSRALPTWRTTNDLVQV